MKNRTFGNITTFVKSIDNQCYYNDLYGCKIGPSGEAAYRNFLKLLKINKQRITSYSSIITPCYRKEDDKSILSGTHLSCFYLLILISEVDSFYFNSKINSLLHTENISHFSYKANHEYGPLYKVNEVSIPPAKGFPFHCEGYELLNYNNLEIANFVNVYDYKNKIVGKMAAFGMERLLMNDYGTSNIWNVPFFAEAECSPKNNLKLDKVRSNLISLNKISKDFSKSIIDKNQFCNLSTALAG